MALIRNLIKNPSVRNGVGWSSHVDGSATYSTVAVSSSFPGSGAAFLSFSANSSPGAVIKVTEAVTAGQILSPGLHVSTTRQQTFVLVVTFLNASNTPIASAYGDPVLVPANSPTRLSLNGSALGAVPAGATKVTIAASVDLVNGSTWLNGNIFAVSKASLTETPAVSVWFDGNSTGAGWLGTPDASASELAFDTQPILTPHTTMDPSPRVDVLFEGIHPDAVTATLYQISSDGQVVVRNGDAIFAAGGFFLVDYEVPLGVTVTYRAELFDSDGESLGFTDTTSVQVDIAEDVAVISDPLDPAAAVLVGAEQKFAESLSRTRQLQLHQIGNQTIALMGAMGLLENVNLRTYTRSTADQVMFDEVLDRTQVLVRTMPPMPIPRALHVVIPNPVRVPTDIAYGGTFNVWDIEGSEVTRSTLDIIVPVVNWQVYIDAFPTWDAYDSAYSTWLAAAQDPPSEV